MGKREQTNLSSEFERLEYIKRLVVIAMFRDEELTNRFVLKGGNAIDLILCSASVGMTQVGGSAKLLKT